MTRIFTPPDLDFDRTIPKVFIRNCPWTQEEMINLVEHLGDKRYDIYVYHESMNDLQWEEGIRTSSTKTYNWKNYKNMQPLEILEMIDRDF